MHSMIGNYRCIKYHSSVTRSLFHFQPAVYCLNYDAGAQSKDIHATMTDKCCQARSRTRGFQ